MQPPDPGRRLSLLRGLVLKRREIVLTGPEPCPEEGITVTTLGRRTDLWSFMEQREDGALRPLWIDGRCPTFHSEAEAIKWVLA